MAKAYCHYENEWKDINKFKRYEGLEQDHEHLMAICEDCRLQGKSLEEIFVYKNLGGHFKLLKLNYATLAPSKE